MIGYLHKKVVITSFLLLFISTTVLQAQIGINTINPNSQAMLDIVALNKGVLLPRLNTTQRNTISNPVAGLTIYNTTTQSIEWYTGSAWFKPNFITYSPTPSTPNTTYTPGVGINTTQPHTSSILEVFDAARGFLFPRLSQTQINAITNPVNGLLLYNTTTSSLEWFNGSSWYNPAKVPFAPVISTIATTTTSATVSFSSVANASSYTLIAQPGNHTITGTASPLTVSNLTMGTSYTFSVFTTTATNSNSNPSATVAAATLDAIANAPTALTPLPGNGSINLSWTASTGVVTSYKVYYKIVGASSWSTLTANSNAIDITGLQNNQTYVLKVTALNSGGESPDSQVLYSSPIENQLLLYENFNSTTFNTATWYEYDGYSPANNPLSGNVRIEGGQLRLVSGDWTENASYLKTNQIYGKVAANLVIEMDMTSNGSYSSFKYGELINWSNNGNFFRIRRNPANKIETSTNMPSLGKNATISGASASIPMHVKMVYKSAGGIDIYVDGILSTALSFTAAQLPANLVEFPITFVGLQSSPLFIDNVVVSGLPTAPNPPTAVTAQAGGSSAGVFFTPPTSTGGSPITSYTVIATPGNITASGSASPVQVTSLINGTSYTFTVKANNAYGSSVNSEVTNAVVPQSAINPPLVYAHNAKILLQWQPTYDAIDYEIAFKPSTTSNWVVYNDGVSTKTVSSIVGLNNGITYDIRIKPLTSSGSYDFSTPVSTTPTASYNPNVWHQIVSTGQSLSVGANGAPALSVTQPYNNKMLNSGLTAFTPLIEPATSTGGSNSESISSAMANSISQFTLPSQNFNSIVTLNGIGNTAYSGLKKGTGAYTNSINRVIAAKNIALTTTQTPYIVSAVTVIHGENDSYSTPNVLTAYKAFLEEWQNDYQTDIQAITGQTDIIPLFTDQLASNTAYGTSRVVVGLAQLQAAIDNPTKIYLVGPKYIYDYSDAVHMNNYSYRRHGEYYGKVMKKVLVDKQPWVPLSPSTITRSNNVITVNFHVPVAPLQFDTTAVMPVANYGFEYINAGSEITITNVALGANGTSVILTLSGTPTTPGQVGYAYTGVNGTPTGRFIAGSTKGNLCDSDPTPALNQDSSTPANMGTTLKNWCVQFVKDVN